METEAFGEGIALVATVSEEYWLSLAESNTWAAASVSDISW